jgi:monoamine oxidase
MVCTNLNVFPITSAEAGEQYELLRPVVNRLRKEDPDRYKGREFADVAAELLSTESRPVSAGSVRTALTASRKARKKSAAVDESTESTETIETTETPDEPKDAVSSASLDAENALLSMTRAIKRLAKARESGAEIRTTQIDRVYKDFRDLRKLVKSESE